MLEELFSHQVTHLTGEAGAGKSLLLLWHVGEAFLDGGARTLWIDADNNFAPSRAVTMFGNASAAVLSSISVARPTSLAELKRIASELAARDLPPDVRFIALDSASRLPRLALSGEANTPTDVNYLSRDFFENVIEPLIVVASREQVQLVLTHQNSQDAPFWWDYYPAREGRIHLATIPGNRTTREIHNAAGEVTGILHLAAGGIQITEPKPKKKFKITLPQGAMFRSGTQ
jgi:hypothetical protein